MRYRELGATGCTVSELGLGTMMFGEQTREADAHRLIDIALDAGVNLVDTAESYPVPPRADTCGDAESCIGRWIARHRRRHELFIATKATGPGIHLPHIRDGRSVHTATHLAAALDGSLRRLGTDHVDLYQLHWPDRATNMFGQLGYKPARREESPHLEETLRALEDFVAAGKVRFIGVSNETPWGLMSLLALSDALGLPRVAAIQNPYNLLNRTFEVGLAEVAHRERVGLIAYSPLAFGTLSGKYLNGERPSGTRLQRYDRFVRYNRPAGIAAIERYVALADAAGCDRAHLAISFILSRSYCTSVLIGARNEEQLRHNLAGARFQPDKSLLKAIDRIHSQIPNPCP